jgi:chemotaxis regulatin CheY-phosphate phosphatase CheZ
MVSTWATIDALVHDIGELSADVQMAERTLATDPRTHAARTGLDRATDAVSIAIDQASESAVQRAASAIDETRALIAQLGLNVRRGRSLVDAAQKLVATAEREQRRMAVLRSRLEKRMPKG